MSWIQEFKTFALKGNMVDMAVGIIIGSSFNNVVNSLVNDIIMPPLGLLLGGVNFNKFHVVLRNGLEDQKDLIFEYGKFISTLFDFTIVAFAVFLLIKSINRFRKENKKEDKCHECLMIIPVKAKRCGHCGVSL
ncbi:large-conductance mechanosensitive channel protein MscL [Chlamydiales bacterium]|nr:large-conductance mechanosensitive channel protein MscL [Chlamydiales bacterium]